MEEEWRKVHGLGCCEGGNEWEMVCGKFKVGKVLMVGNAFSECMVQAVFHDD